MVLGPGAEEKETTADLLRSAEVWRDKVFYHYDKFARPCMDVDSIRDRLEKCKALYSKADGSIPYEVLAYQFVDRLRLLRVKRKGSRVTAVTYKWIEDADTKRILFQFATFVDRTGKEQFVKSDLRKTAQDRLRKKPLLLEVEATVPNRAIRPLLLKAMSSYRRPRMAAGV